jgi:thiamine biosynthesis lipoprotein
MDALLSPRRRHLVAAFGAAALGVGCGRGTPDAAAGRAEVLRLAGATMGTTFGVRIAGGPFAAGFEREAHAAVSAAFAGVVGRMSGYDPGSEVARLNRHAATTPFALSGQTVAVLERAQQIARASGGAFDVTVAPLVGAWGFGAAAAPRSGLPDARSLASPVGWRGLALDPGTRLARKADPALQVDLSGIAKGHGVDRAAQALADLGARHFMVEAGGEIRTRGRNGQGLPWRIAIERPDAWPQQVQRVLALSDASIATSGDYRNFWEHAGRRIHHGIDPRTRAPSDHRLASVSVLHEECMAADAWATALFVLGPERGRELAEAERLSALFIVRERGGALREFGSTAFQRMGRT